MREEKITIYRCDFCSKHYHNTNACKKHEDICLFDPEKKACGSCVFSSQNYIQCGMNGNKLDNKNPVTGCIYHKSIDDYEDGK